MRIGGMLVKALIIAMIAIGVASTPASAQPKEDSVKQALQNWDHICDEKGFLLEILPKYDIDPSFMTSGKPKDDFISQELIFRFRDFALSDSVRKPTPYEYKQLSEYINDDAIYSKVKLFLDDVWKMKWEIVDARNQKVLKEREEEDRLAALAKQEEQDERAEQIRVREQEEAKKAEADEQRLEKMRKRAIRAGYPAGVCDGIEITIMNLSGGSETLKNVRRCLIEPDGSDLNGFKVQGIVGNHVIYFQEDSGTQFALVKEPGRFYGNTGLLEDGFFKVLGSQNFRTVLGTTSELIVLKRVNFNP